MSKQRVNFHKLEDYDGDCSIPFVVCSFETDRFGYYQVKYRKLNGEFKIKLFKNEPDINVFSKKEQKYIERCLAIVWRMVFDAPAAKQRFVSSPKGYYEA